MNILNSDINDCYRTAREELSKITCYDIDSNFETAYTHHSYSDGCYYAHNEGDRGEKFTSKVGSTRDEFISHLLYRKIWDFSLSYEVHHRRRFEDNRRQMNEIIERCYSYLDDKYEYSLMGDLKDNIHICFDLLDHYILVCRKLVNKNTIPENVMKRIRFIANKEYGKPMGGMYDAMFSLDLVRYNVTQIIKALPVTEEEFLKHETQYDRLLTLEKQAPCEPERYPLGTWDNDVFCEAEEMLNGKRLTDGDALKCALYMLMMLVRHDRAVGMSIDLCFHKDIDIEKYRPVLNEIFISDKYSLYHFGSARNLSENKKNRLTYKLLCGDTAERQL